MLPREVLPLDGHADTTALKLKYLNAFLVFVTLASAVVFAVAKLTPQPADPLGKREPWITLRKLAPTFEAVLLRSSRDCLAGLGISSGTLMYAVDFDYAEGQLVATELSVQDKGTTLSAEDRGRALRCLERGERMSLVMPEHLRDLTKAGAYFPFELHFPPPTIARIEERIR